MNKWIMAVVVQVMTVNVAVAMNNSPVQEERYTPGAFSLKKLEERGRSEEPGAQEEIRKLASTPIFSSQGRAGCSPLELVATYGSQDSIARAKKLVPGSCTCNGDLYKGCISDNDMHKAVKYGNPDMARDYFSEELLSQKNCQDRTPLDLLAERITGLEMTLSHGDIPADRILLNCLLQVRQVFYGEEFYEEEECEEEAEEQGNFDDSDQHKSNGFSGDSDVQDHLQNLARQTKRNSPLQAIQDAIEYRK